MMTHLYSHGESYYSEENAQHVTMKSIALPFSNIEKN